MKAQGKEGEVGWPCVSHLNDRSMLNKRKQYKKETERGGNADAEPVAPVALHGETPAWPPAHGAARGFI